MDDFCSVFEKKAGGGNEIFILWKDLKGNYERMQEYWGTPEFKPDTSQVKMDCRVDRVVW
jgi:hypothetical protein